MRTAVEFEGQPQLLLVGLVAHLLELKEESVHTVPIDKPDDFRGLHVVSEDIDDLLELVSPVYFKPDVLHPLLLKVVELLNELDDLFLTSHIKFVPQLHSPLVVISFNMLLLDIRSKHSHPKPF